MKTSFSKKLLLCVAALTVGILGATIAQTQPEVPAWVRTYNGQAESDDRARKVALDSSGNVIVAGSSDAGIEGINGSDWLIIKYSNSGMPLWTNLYSGPDNSVDGANAVAEDSSGNVIVTGYSYNFESDYFNYVTIKYSGAGLPLWTNRHDAPWPFRFFGQLPTDLGNGVTVDGSDNVFVAGGDATLAYSSSGVPLWTNRYPASKATGLVVDRSGDVVVTGRESNYDDYVTVKYSQAGLPLWTNRYALCGYGTGYSVAVDSQGSAFVAGSTDCNGSAIVAYSSTGMPLWTNHYTDPWYDLDAPSAGGVALDGKGNVFVTASSSGSGISDHVAVSDFVTVAYSNAGLPLWTNRYHGPGIGKDIASGLALDGSGNVYVTGSSVGSGGYYEYATIKYSGAGVPLWTNRFSSSGDSQATSVAVDASGNVFVAGESWNGSSFDYLTVKYSSVGVPLLTITRTTSNQVVLSWDSPSEGFTLQQNTSDIASPDWSNVLTTPADDGTTRTVILSPTAERAFYRLIHP